MKQKLTKKQEKMIKDRKVKKEIDSNNLRAIIKAKLEWTKQEINRGKIQQQNIQVAIYRLEGIVAFIEDLLIPIEKEINDKY